MRQLKERKLTDMFTSVDVDKNNKKNLILFDTHDLQIVRGSGNDCEIVIHPCCIGKLSVRYAKEPYCCKIKVRHGKKRAEWIDIDLSCEEDWGEIDTTDPKKPMYGNDEDGYVAITEVISNERRIPLEQFSRDVSDFIIYHEC